MHKTDTVVVILLAITAAAVLLLSYIEVPPLVGHDCLGTTGDIYAFEEDHFPMCREIESTRK